MLNWIWAYSIQTVLSTTTLLQIRWDLQLTSELMLTALVFKNNIQKVYSYFQALCLKSGPCCFTCTDALVNCLKSSIIRGAFISIRVGGLFLGLKLLFQSRSSFLTVCGVSQTVLHYVVSSLAEEHRSTNRHLCSVSSKEKGEHEELG